MIIIIVMNNYIYVYIYIYIKDIMVKYIYNAYI